MKVSIIGAGSWGTALAQAASDNQHLVNIYARSKETVLEINNYHTNKRYLKEARLSDKIFATDSLKEAVEYGEILIIAVPTKSMREICNEINKYLNTPKYIIHVSKGLEVDTNLRMSEVIEEVILEEKLLGVGVLSGPSHAEELILRHPTVVAIASKNKELSQIAQKIFQNEYFRIYVNEDIIGVEIGGSLKNIIALGCGMLDGLGLGDNAKAALINRGLVEIIRMGKKLGANELTFIGLGGIGDLIVTCTSKHSRNYNCGYLIGKGYTLEEAVEKLSMVAEGVRTTKVCYLMSKKYNVYMPITENIYNVLYNNMSLEKCVSNLMSGLASLELNNL